VAIRLPGRWRSRLAVLSGLVALYAVIGFFVVPPIAKSQIVKLARSKLHREASVQKIAFNPFTLTGRIEGLKLSDRDGVPLAGADEIRADFEVSGLFRRAWRFREIAIRALDLRPRILADGKLSISDLLEPTPGEPASSGLPRLIIDHFVLSGGRAEFVDESRTPRFVQAFEPLDFELHELVTIPREGGDHAITIGLGTGASVKWSGRQTVDPLKLEGHLELGNMQLGRVWDYAVSGVPLIAKGRVDVVLDYEAHREADRSVGASIKNAKVMVREVELTPKDGSPPWLELPAAEASGIGFDWPAAKATVARVRIGRPNLRAHRNADGTLDWLSALPPGETKSGPLPVQAAIDEIELTGGRLAFRDSSVTPEVTTELSDMAAKLKDVSTDLAHPVGLEASTAINGAGHASVSGTAAVSPLAAALDVDAGGIDLTPYQPYAVRFPGADIKKATGHVKGRVRLSDGAPRVEFEGAGGVDALEIAGAGEDHLIACDSANATGVHVTVAPGRARVALVRLDGAFLKLHIDKAGNVNLSRLRMPADAPAGAGTPAAPTPGTFPVEIAKIEIKGAMADYTDESLILPFGTKIHDVNGDVRDISTTSAAAARLALEGRVADSGYVKVDGSLRPADPLAAADIGVVFRNVNMPDLTPYAAQFAGYSLEKGVLDVDVRYRIENRHLVGEHHVVAKDLVLGPKVEGAKGPGLPVRLAVALLKDKDGRIDLQVPVEGAIDSPEFGYKKVFWQAFKQILGNVVKAPFRAIAHLFGAGGTEDLELVGFASGRSELPAPEAEKLAKMAPELQAKGEIALEIEGRYDPVTDLEAIREARLESRIDAKRTGEQSLDAILEALYVETYSKDMLEAKRASYTPGAAIPAVSTETGEKPKKAQPAADTGGTTDAAGFYDSVRRQLLDVEKVEPSELEALARARGAAIAAALTAGGLDASRVKVLDPAPAKKKMQGSEFVASEMMMNAKD